MAQLVTTLNVDKNCIIVSHLPMLMAISGFHLLVIAKWPIWILI